MKNYSEIVLTGGPSAGKTTILSRLVAELQEEGIRTITIPEAATMLFMGGVGDMAELQHTRPDLYEEVEKQILLLQRDLRRRYRELALSFSPQRVCLIYDRGEMDVASYLSSDLAHQYLRESGDKGIAHSRDSYDCVIYLRTSAALGSEHYGKNNPARIEDAKEALRSDERTLQAWIGHPHLWVVEAKSDFEEKFSRVVEILRHSIGVPHSMEIERKFLVASPRKEDLHDAYRVEIKQTYLQSSEGERRVRRRKCQYGKTYHRTEKQGQGLERRESEALIGKREYRRLLEERDPNRKPLRKTRYHFVWQGRHYELDHFYDRDLWILEAELLRSEEEVEIPDFLTLEKEITDEPGWSSRDLAS